MKLLRKLLCGLLLRDNKDNDNYFKDRDRSEQRFHEPLPGNPPYDQEWMEERVVDRGK